MAKGRIRRVFRSLRWGFHAPGGCCLWWLIKETGYLHILGELPFDQMDERDLASAMRTKDSDLGLGLTAQGDYRTLGIAHVAYTVATPAIISKPKEIKPGFRGETIGDRLLHYGIPLIAADEDALNGWKRCQSLLQLDGQGIPYLTIDPSCTALQQGIQSGLQDADHTDDVSNPSPALVAFRYGAMSRPTPGVARQETVIPPGSPADVMRRLRAERAGRQWGQVR